MAEEFTIGEEVQVEGATWWGRVEAIRPGGVVVVRVPGETQPRMYMSESLRRRPTLDDITNLTGEIVTPQWMSFIGEPRITLTDIAMLGTAPREFRLFGGTPRQDIVRGIEPIEPQETGVMDFQAGDTVEFVGPREGGTSVYIGDRGRVTEIIPDYERSGLAGVRVYYEEGSYRGTVVYCDRYIEGGNPCWTLAAIRRVERERTMATETVGGGGFRVGDRVRYVGGGGNPGFGAEGEVRNVYPDRVWVRWESGPMTTRDWEARTLWTSHPEYQIDTLQRIGEAPVEPSPRRQRGVYREGDRVVYIGPRPEVEEGEEESDYAPEYGTEGEVTRTSDTDIRVRWSNNYEWYYSIADGETEHWWQLSALMHQGDLDPAFPYRVGLRYYHRFADGTYAHRRGPTDEVVNDSFTVIITEINREERRVNTRAEVEGFTPRYSDSDIDINRHLARLVLVPGQIDLDAETLREEKKMTSTCSLVAELNAGEKAALARWIKGVLDNPEGDNPFPGGLDWKIAISYQGQAAILRNERWRYSAPYLQVGRTERDGETRLFPISHRLAVGMTLMQLVEPSEELKVSARVALGRYLMGEYQELTKGQVVVAKKKPEGLAFSGDKVAAKIGEDWVLPMTGEPVKVVEGEWTICSM